MAVGFGLAGTARRPVAVPIPVAQTRQAPASPPVWAECVVDLEAALRLPTSDFRSSMPFRGIAAAASTRPSVVLASYEFEHCQDGPELENLTLALNALNRLVIPPRGVLSFNETVGPRLESRGFQPGLMFSRGKVVTGVGGGVCVASTALYNCALEAGLPIVERWMHSGPTSYARPSRDAAVVFGLKDMRIKNNTASPVWVLTRVADGVVHISLLSQQAPAARVALREEGQSHIPFALQIQPGEEPDVMIIQKGAPGCDVKLVREFWVGSKLRKTEVVCHDTRKPVTRIVGIPASGEAAPTLSLPGLLPEPVLKPLEIPRSAPAEPAGPEPLMPNLSAP